MPLARYEDFVLVADHVERDAEGVIASFEVRVFDSPVGQGEKYETVTVPPDLTKRVRRLEDRRLDGDLEGQVELGTMLGDLLLPAYARGLFAASVARLGEDDGIRLRLRLADELPQLPWEFACVRAHRGEQTGPDFLALNPRISIVRHEVMAEPVPGSWFEAPAKRRVVVAMASPGPHELYRKLPGLPREQRALKAALACVAGVEADYLPDYGDQAAGGDDEVPGITFDALLGALLSGRADIFHFAGHGEFTKEMGAALGSVVGVGALVLADEANQAFAIRADRLGLMLADKGIRLAVLGACETGRRDGQNVWSSVAASLLRAGIPAVVAMQFTVDDGQAAEFAGAFYRALAAGLTIDESVALGRTAMRVSSTGEAAERRDWAVPVVYLRNSGGRVFNPVSDRDAVQEAVAQATRLIEQSVRRVAAGGVVVGVVADPVKAEQNTVRQKVSENLHGLVVGALQVSGAPGKLHVVQEVDTVEAGGSLIGSVTSSSDPMELLRRELRAVTPQAGLCKDCGRPLPDDVRFCPGCGAAAGR